MENMEGHLILYSDDRYLQLSDVRIPLIFVSYLNLFWLSLFFLPFHLLWVLFPSPSFMSAIKQSYEESFLIYSIVNNEQE